MKQKIRRKLLKNTKLQIIIGTIVAVLCLMVWPFQKFHHSAYSHDYGSVQPFYTDAVTMEQIALIQIFPAEEHIRDISIACLVENVKSQDRVFVTLYDADYEIVYQEVVYFYDIETRGYIFIEPDMDVSAGGTYYIGLNVHYESEGTLHIAYAPEQETQISECGTFTYAYAQLSGMSGCIRMHYTAGYPAWLLILFVLGIITAGALLYIGISCIQVWIREKGLGPKVRCIRRKVVAIAAVAADLICFYFLCIVRKFGTGKWDVAMYAIACITVLAGIVYTYCFIGRQGQKKRRRSREGGLVFRNYLQTVCFLFLFWEGISYVNSAIQWKQDLSRNWVFLLFGVLVLLNFKLRDLINPATVVFSLVMIPCGMVYCHVFGVDSHALRCARVMTGAMAVWGIVLIRTVRNIGKIREQSTNWFFAICWALMCILMIVNRYGKLWPILMAVSFSLFYLQGYTEKQKKQLVHNLINGILANFGFVVIMCLLYRPYHYYQFNRYPMWFHTVASTGMYLAMVEAAAILRLYFGMRKHRTVWLRNEKEWILNAVVIAYISMTIARTTILAVLGVVLIMIVGTMIVYRVGLKKYAQTLGTAVLICCLCFPAVYTATRCIPAVVNKPVYLTETENFDYAVKKGEALDSANYMNVRALFRLWVDRTGIFKGVLWKYLDDTAVNISPNDVRILCDTVSADDMVSYPENMTDTGNAANADSTERTATINDMSNGRIAVFIAYLERLNLNGHAQMSFEMEDGWTPGHAHNSFIQNAYDFGIPAGILFLAIILGMFLYAVYQIWIRGDHSELQFFTLIISAMMLLISISEYASNPCMPLCFATLFMLLTMRKEKSVL